MRSDITAKGEHCSEVYLEDFIPVIVRELVGSMPTLYASTVEKDINPPSVF